MGIFGGLGGNGFLGENTEILFFILVFLLLFFNGFGAGYDRNEAPVEE